MFEAKSQIGANDVAIIGMALRVPGASSTSEFWDNLRNGVESIRDLSGEELLESGEDPLRIRDPRYVARAAELPDMEMFDADFFGLSPKEASIMDPQHRQFMECAWEAIEDAGRIPSQSGEPVGVFAGCGMGSYFYFNVCSNRDLVDQVGMFLLRHTGNDKDFLATRTSYLFDLKGPSINVQTACSTSLVAVHFAAQSLLNGECDMALAGGVTIEFPHRRGYIFNPGEILSPDGHCRPFDHRAAGTVFGSGTGVVVLRRLEDALRDGDTIHAVIKGTAINNDGGGKAGYLAPSVAGQAQVVVEAQAIADIDAETIGYVECHGTGTNLGDPIEIEALTQAFRQSTHSNQFCYVGSVKSNIGHLDTAAGVVSLIKAALSLKHGEIPPTLGFEKPNPAVDFDRSPFMVCSKLSPWPIGNGPRRAAVHSLGVGGTNAHVVLEEAPVPYSKPEEMQPDEARDSPVLLLLSARTRRAVDVCAQRLGTWLTTNPDIALKDVAHTLLHCRKKFDEWIIVAARNREEALAVLTDTTHAVRQSTLDRAEAGVFMFPGGGVQYPGMAKNLYERDRLFRAVVDEGLSYLPPEVADKISDVWLGEDAEDAAALFLKPSLQLPAILVTEVALAKLWQQRGLEPIAMIGHSMGEYAAACVAGVMTLKDAVQLVRFRGELFERVQPSGMLSVPLDEEALLSRLPETLDLACVNGPSLCVVSGLDEDLQGFEKFLNDNAIEARRLAIDIAAHSRLLDPILSEFEAFVAGLELRAPTIPIISNLSGAPMRDDEATDPRYWRDHLRQTVRFAQGLMVLSSEPGFVFIEAGPGRVLSSLAKAQGIAPSRVIHSLPHMDELENDQAHFHMAMGRAYAAGLPVDLNQLTDGPGSRRVSLPSYPFQHQRYFIEPNRLNDNRLPPVILSKQTDIEQWGYRPCWQRSVANVLRGAANEHKVWLLFLDNDGFGTVLAEKLRNEGHHVVTVSRGDGFRQRQPDEYTLCAEVGGEDYRLLLESLRSRKIIPDHVVHMWLADRMDRVRAGSSRIHQDQDWGFSSLFDLGQAWANMALDGQLAISIVTRNVLKVDNDEKVSPDKAMVLGPALVLPKELPGVTVRLLDIAAGQPERTPSSIWPIIARPKPMAAETGNQTLVDQLWDEIHGVAGNEVVAIRGERRFTRIYERCPLKRVETVDCHIKDRGVYFFAGGLSEVALSLAFELATKHQARLILVARLKLPPQEHWNSFRPKFADPRVSWAIAKIKCLQEAGADVFYVKADITDGEQMTRAVRESLDHFGKIDGVFHCAGALDDGLVQTTDKETLQRVILPKVTGLRVIDAIFQQVHLDFMVLFSSTSTDVPRAGQIGYVAANVYMNAYAQSVASDSERQTLAIHWGIWNEVGLAARAAGAASASLPVEYQTKSNFFDRWVASELNEPFWLEAALSADSHWVLNEHRLLSGNAILPGTAYVDILMQAVGEYDLGNTVRIGELTFIRPLFVDDHHQRQLRVRLEPHQDGYRATIASKEQGEPGAQQIVHAQAVIALARVQPARLDLDSIWAEMQGRMSFNGGAPIASVQADRLRFGPRWAVLRAVKIGVSEAIADLSLDDEFAADLAGHPLHPALLDIATGYALTIGGASPEDDALWVPASYDEIIVYGPLAASIVSWIRYADCEDFGDGFAAFDVTICDKDGNVLVDIHRFVMRRLEGELAQPSPTPESAHPRMQRSAMHHDAARLSLQVEHGIRPTEGLDALGRALALHDPEIIISSIDLETLTSFVADPVGPSSRADLTFERPDLEVEYIEPNSPVEVKLARCWHELLGVEDIGVNDSFFDLGGHSLIAVRLFRAIKDEFEVDLPISTLFEAPTISLCAAKISERLGPTNTASTEIALTPPVPELKRLYAVLMASRPDQKATPLFICAGMFGNILNLRHLAITIGIERPVYGLQAKGLYGDHEPHDTFENMAKDYLTEIRDIQPHGPYLLAGYSGGGLVALEIARQLEDQGEIVAHLALFDTPLPRQPSLSLQDKLSMKLQDVQRHRFAFITTWWHDRRRWIMERAAKAHALQSDQMEEGFNNIRIERAFLEAARVYQVKPYKGHVTLYRPRPRVVYRLPNGRLLQEGRNFILPDNGWRPYLSEMDVVEVPGDHDSMMLDPCVRVLAERLRAVLNRLVSGDVLSPEDGSALPDEYERPERERELVN